MPHKGPRGSPRTDRRNTASPSVMIAAATVAPGGTATGTPLTFTLTISGMLVHACVRNLDGEYGSTSIAGVRFMIRSESSCAVPSEVVMPRPSCPVAR